MLTEIPQYSLGKILLVWAAAAIPMVILGWLVAPATFLGEELLFRGLLLPRMAGAFARADWVANGLLFGVYHLHQPWGIFSSLTHGMLLFALPSRYFRSAWFGITAHSGQSIFFSLLMLLLILGVG
jgi:membrane protease YdiL (CAAX protease family)